MKKKVLIINHSLQQGGIVRSLIEALNVIDPDKYDVTVYVHRDVPDLADLVPSYVRVVVNHDTNHYFRLPKAVVLQAKIKLYNSLGRSKDAEIAQTELNDFIRSKKVLHPQCDYFSSESFDIVISYSVDICTEIALAIPAARHFAFYHSSKPDFHRDMTERCFPLFDKIVAVSHGVEEVLLGAFPALSEKIVCLDNFVNGAELKRRSEESIISVPKRPVICSCGRLNSEKGFDLAVEAAHELKTRGHDFVWYFVGDGDMRPSLQKTIEEYGLEDNIVITGFLLNPYPYMAACDVYVQPSYEEAQPLAVMEAVILGRPVVSTETVGGRTILENGRKGVLTPFTGAGIADGIEKLLVDEQLRHSFENLYSEEDDRKAFEEYKSAWAELLGS